MIFRVSRLARLVAPPLALCAIVPACSSTPAAPKVFVNAALDQTTSTSGSCNDSSLTQFLQIGTFDVTKALSDSNPQRVTAGGHQSGGTIGINCTVAQTGSTFTVTLNAAISSNIVGQGGSLTIQGTGVDPTQGSNTVTGNFNAGGISYSQDMACTLSFTYMGSPVVLAGGAPPIAPGRIWGHVDCPAAKATSGQSFVCDAQADFVFENCGG